MSSALSGRGDVGELRTPAPDRHREMDEAGYRGSTRYPYLVGKPHRRARRTFFGASGEFFGVRFLIRGLAIFCFS
jgi:hypothetical protein